MMNKIFAAACVLAAGTMLWGQADEAKLREAMKQIGPTCSGLAKKIAAKDDSAATDAKKLQGWFGDVHKFWKAKAAADGVTFSESAAAEFKTISEQAAAGK